ncbi:HD domain-containing protein [Thermophagus sp. OGC60D27]|uniref:HDIG domain-containing metalloprotein n=1 Tax=Thermophagus sp. OGC60D27 TaxID=3458415 RepID=UPI00403837D2
MNSKIFERTTDRAQAILDKYYPDHHPARNILLIHSTLVQKKALEIADNHPELDADHQFLAEAALLHDIGIFQTYAPKIGCHGTHPYICHGYLGREILEKEGLPRHALVCERHTGTGLTANEIQYQNLPLPIRDMIPVSIEEQIICFADLFFSKGREPEREKNIDEITRSLEKYGNEKVEIFLKWKKIFL